MPGHRPACTPLFNKSDAKANYSANHLPKNLTLRRKDAKFLIINDFCL